MYVIKKTILSMRLLAKKQSYLLKKKLIENFEEN